MKISYMIASGRSQWRGEGAGKGGLPGGNQKGAAKMGVHLRGELELGQVSQVYIYSWYLFTSLL